MNTDTLNTTTLRKNSGTAAASSEGSIPRPDIALPDLSTRVDTEIIGALEAGLHGVLTSNIHMAQDAMARLTEAIEQGEEEEEEEVEEGKEEGKEKEKEKEKDGNVPTATVTTAPPAGTRILGPQAAHHTSSENSKVARSSAPLAMVHRTITATDKCIRAYWAGISRRTPQPPLRRSMRIMELVQKRAQDKLAVASSGQEEEPALAAPIGKVIVEGPSGQVAQKTKAKADMGKEKKAAVKIKCPILKPKAGAGVTKKAVAKGLRDGIEQKVKARDRVERGKSITAATTTDGATEMPQFRAPPKVLPPQRQSMRITESMQKSAQEEGESSVAARAKREKAPGAGLRGQIAERAVIDTKSKVLKPRAGAGVTKRAVVRGMRGRIGAKAKGSVEMEKELENQNVTPSTTSDKANEAPRARNPPKVLHGPRRRSMRIIESMLRPAQREEGIAAPALAEGEEIAGRGLIRQIAVAVLINVKPPIPKSRTGAGVQKRKGRGRSCGDRSGKPPGGKEPSA